MWDTESLVGYLRAEERPQMLQGWGRCQDGLLPAGCWRMNVAGMTGRACEASKQQCTAQAWLAAVEPTSGL